MNLIYNFINLLMSFIKPQHPGDTVIIFIQVYQVMSTDEEGLLDTIKLERERKIITNIYKDPLHYFWLIKCVVLIPKT